MEYAERDVYDNFNTFQQSAQIELVLIVHGANGSTSRATKIV